MANPTRTEQSGGSAAATQAALGKDAAARAASAGKASGYGLPCAKCHLYYAADLDACPACNNKERVSAVTAKLPAKAAQPAPETVPDTATIEREREEFLRQFKSQLIEAHAEVMNAPESVCKFKDHHPGEDGKGEICTGCYERLQERLDVCEAALHLDLKEAAQIIYDAVWADPSDTGKTYQNAASALLGELRKRAGITTLMGPFQSLSH